MAKARQLGPLAAASLTARNSVCNIWLNGAGMTEVDVIARTWRGTATSEKADGYCRHFMTNVVPHLKEIAGHEGASLLRRQVGGEVEFLAVTLWDSMESIRAFAGRNPDVAVVEPEARAVLTTFDEAVHHYEVVYTDRQALRPRRRGGDDTQL